MKKPLRIDAKDVYRQLGYPANAVPDAYTRYRVAKAIDELLATANPRRIKQEFIRTDLESILVGKDIERHLVRCQHCLVLATTLGSQIDTLIRKASVSDMNATVLMDAAASVFVEDVIEEMETEARQEYKQAERYLTSRYSPGYGDFPIGVQNELLRLMDAGRKIGLYATSSHILTPRKSITAVCGLSVEPVTGYLAGCDTCTLAADCQYKKEGKTCARKHI